MDEGLNAMRTPFENGKVCFNIPLKYAPLTLGFVVSIGNGVQDGENIVTPFSGPFFSVPIGYQRGHATPLGSSVIHNKSSRKIDEGAVSIVNFAVHAQGCSFVSLVLVKGIDGQGKLSSDVKVVEVALDPSQNRTGSIWHIALPCESNIVGYGWRVNGDLSWEKGYRVSPEKCLIDPEAPLMLYVEDNPALEGFPIVNDDDSIKMIAISAIRVLEEPTKQNEDEQSGTLLNRSVPQELLDIDVRSFGFDLPDVQNPGTFAALVESISLLKKLGVESVVLDCPYVCSPGGNRAMSLFAPDPYLSNTGSGIKAHEEFKQMVYSLHQAGIQVFMSLDLTFTADGSDDSSTTVSWRGLDNKGYYRPNGVLNCGSPIAQESIIRALRHWHLEYHIDGYNFLNAENLVQDANGLVMDAPAFPDALCHDPILSGTHLIASPSDDGLLPREGKRGFPHWGRWRERNSGGMSMVQYFLTPTPSVEYTQSAAVFLSGRPHLFAPQYEGFPGNLSISRSVKYSIIGLNSAPWHADEAEDNVIETAASASRAAMLAAGTDDVLPTEESMTKAILLAVIFCSGAPCISAEVIERVPSITDFLRDALEARRKVSHILDSDTIGTWLTSSGAHPNWEDGSIENGFLSRLITGVRGALFIALNPERRTIEVNLPAGYIWTRLFDSQAADQTSSEMEPLPAGPSYPIPSKSVCVFLSS